MASHLYATLEDLAACGVPEEALRDITDAEKLKALAQASREADMRLAARYSLPLVSWGEDLIQVVCIIAAFRLLTFLPIYLTNELGYAPAWDELNRLN